MMTHFNQGQKQTLPFVLSDYTYIAGYVANWVLGRYGTKISWMPTTYMLLKHSTKVDIRKCSEFLVDLCKKEEHTPKYVILHH